ELRVEGVVTEKEGDLTRQPLRLVDGPGVPVLELLGDVLEGKGDLASRVGPDLHAVTVGAGDLGEVTVEDAEVIPVVKGEHPVPDAEALLVDRRDDLAEGSGRFEQRVGAAVEVPNIAAMDCTHDRVSPCGTMRPPVEHHAVSKRITVRRNRQMPASVETLDGGAGIAIAQGSDDCPLGRIALAPVLGELDDIDAFGERGEQAARLDGRKLLRVTDQDELGVDGGSLFGERGEEPGAEHGGLVDHED